MEELPRSLFSASQWKHEQTLLNDSRRRGERSMDPEWHLGEAPGRCDVTCPGSPCQWLQDSHVNCGARVPVDSSCLAGLQCALLDFPQHTSYLPLFSTGVSSIMASSQ